MIGAMHFDIQVSVPRLIDNSNFSGQSETTDRTFRPRLTLYNITAGAVVHVAVPRITTRETLFTCHIYHISVFLYYLSSAGHSILGSDTTPCAYRSRSSFAQCPSWLAAQFSSGHSFISGGFHPDPHHRHPPGPILHLAPCPHLPPPSQ